MLESIKNVLVSLTEEGRNESASSLDFAFFLAERSSAHLTVHAASKPVDQRKTKTLKKSRLHLMTSEAWVRRCPENQITLRNRPAQALGFNRSNPMLENVSQAAAACPNQVGSEWSNQIA
jgi:hypothetical protein